MAETDPIQELREALARLDAGGGGYIVVGAVTPLLAAHDALLAKLADAEAELAESDARQYALLTKLTELAPDMPLADLREAKEKHAAALSAAEERGRKAGRVEGLEEMRTAVVSLIDKKIEGLAQIIAAKRLRLQPEDMIAPVESKRFGFVALAEQVVALASSVQPSPTADAQSSADKGSGADGWRSMESAPKGDGTTDDSGPWLMLFIREEFVPVITFWNWHTKDWAHRDEIGGDEPTAWQPLPAPPGVK